MWASLYIVMGFLWPLLPGEKSREGPTKEDEEVGSFTQERIIFKQRRWGLDKSLRAYCVHST